MSVVIVAMTPTIVAVASDSMMSGAKEKHHANKIFLYRNNMVMYAAGNAGIAMAYFDSLYKHRKKFGRVLTFDDAVASAREWRDNAERDPFWKPVKDSAIGVCGIENGLPCAFTTMTHKIMYFMSTLLDQRKT